jgi:hypothetical protein
MDRPGIPLYLFFLVFVAVPCGFAILFGWLTFATMTPLTFRCCRCRHEFQQSARKRFPSHCPSCRARDWNLPA